METKEIRMGKTSRLGSVNRTENVPVEIGSTSVPLVMHELKETVDLYEQYKKEYGECKRYRLTLTVKPYCTNVLFNMCTEIVKDEGNGDGTVIASDCPGYEVYVEPSVVYGKSSSLRRIDMLYNTEYSDKKVGYTYLPGYDIFDSHTLRNLSFRPIMKPSPSASGKPAFNTMSDVMRRNDGSVIQFYPRFSYGDAENPNRIDRHVYESANVLPFYDGSSASVNLSSENGWYGFSNVASVSDDGTNAKSSIDDRSDKHVFESTLNNVGGCDFVDMFPDRTRFSMVPKYNKFLHRYEKNWDIFLTYPWKNFYMHNLVSNVKRLDNTALNADSSTKALTTMRVVRKVTSTNRKTMLFRTFTKHGLTVDDSIIVYVSKNYGYSYVKLGKEYTVDYVGDEDGNNKDYFFGISSKEFLNEVFYGDVESLFYEPYSGAIPIDAQTISGEFVDIPDETEVARRKITKKYFYEAETTPSTYTSANTFDAIPKTVSDYTPVHIRVWNGNYVYEIWDEDNEQYEAAQGASEGVEYGKWNTYTDVPSERKADYIRVKCYGFYRRRTTFHRVKTSIIQKVETVDGIIDGKFVDNRWHIRFARVKNGYACKYYIRKFRKVPNLKFSSEPLSADCSKTPAKFLKFLADNATDGNGVMYSFDSETYRLAFSKTLYGDDVAQVTFTDDISVENLTDNLGRPVTEIYATVVKRNKGYKTWYGRNESGNRELISDENCEYSRCFGSVTTGFEYLDLENPYDMSTATRNAKGFMSSIGSIYRNCYNSDDKKVDTKPVEDWEGVHEEITEDDDVFFGDVVEYSPSECSEKVLSDACFRFNTAQRELGRDRVDDDDEPDFNFTYHEIVYDDYDPLILYDMVDDNSGNGKRTASFLVGEYQQYHEGEPEYDIQRSLITFKDGTDERNPERVIKGANGEKFSIRKNEGYYYKPHTKIPLLKFSDRVCQGSNRTLRIKECRPVQAEGMYIKVNTKTAHGVGDNETLYLKTDSGLIETFSSYYIDNYRFAIPVMDKADCMANGKPYYDWVSICEGLNSGSMELRVKNKEIPPYAEQVEDNLYLWREIVNPSDIPEQDDMKYPMANNSFYVDTQVNLYLRRQDPIGINGLNGYGFGEIGGAKHSQMNNEYKKEEEYTC